MRIGAIGLGVVALAACSAGVAQAGTLWIANMTSAKENPPNNTGFSGTGFLVLNNAETQASVTATHNVPANQVTGGHIHRGPVGVNGPIIFPFPNPASPVGPLIWQIPAADVANLKAGLLYMNIHNIAFPNGVIRDQLARVLFDNAATTTNQRAVAGALDVSAGFNPVLDQALFTMAVLPASGQAAALQDLGGDTIYAQGRQPAESMHGFQETILQHIETASPAAPGFSLFGAVNTEFGNRDARDGQAASHVTRTSLLGGVQYAFAGAQAGAAVAWADGKDKFQNGRGQTEAKTKSFQAFAAGGYNILRLSAVAGYGWTNTVTNRNLPSFGLRARSSPDTNVWAVAGRASAPLHVVTNMTLSPYGQIDAQGARVDGYAETNAGALGLVVPKHTYNTTSLELGAALAAPFGSQTSPVTARLQAGWRHLLSGENDSLPLTFIGSPVSFVQRIAGPGKDAAHLDASVTSNLNSRLTGSAGYRGFIGPGGSVHTIEVRLKYAM